MFRETLAFDDVLLVPQRSNIQSRNDVDISTNIFPGVTLGFPVLSANMSTITEVDMAVTMANAEGLGVLHRMQSVEDQIKMVHDVYQNLHTLSLEDSPIAFSFGTHDDWHERVLYSINAGGTVAVLDVAHAHHNNVLDIVRTFYDSFEIPLIVGNIATPKAAEDIIRAAFFDFSRVALKVGIGGGSMCTTRVVTGCGVPTFQSVYDIHSEFPNVVLIADGGIRTSGDIVKAIAAGAGAVMVGSLFAGTLQTPTNLIRSADGLHYKVYRGSASYSDKKARGEEVRNIEGVEVLVPYKGDVWSIINDLRSNIRSGLSYLGASNIYQLHDNAEFVKVTQNGYKESQPHGKV